MLHTQTKSPVEQHLTDNTTILNESGLRAIFGEPKQVREIIENSPFTWNAYSEHESGYDFSGEIYDAIVNVIVFIMGNRDATVTHNDLSNFCYTKKMIEFHTIDATVIFNSAHAILSFTPYEDCIAGAEEKVDIKKVIYG